jgi:hypothetical protein
MLWHSICVIYSDKLKMCGYNIQHPNTQALRERERERDLSNFGFMRKFCLFWFYDLFFLHGLSKESLNSSMF